MTTEDFAGLDPARTVAVLPVAAIEQHGPHLPVATDAEINRAIVTAAVAGLPDDVAATFLPMLPVGKSNEHQAFPGTLTLSAETLIRLWTEIGESVHRAGLRKLVIFNSHGGQRQFLDIVATDLRTRLRMLVAGVSWFDLGMPEGLFSPAERRHGIHAGAIETSAMLEIRPDLVDMSKAADFEPASVALERDYVRLVSEEAGIVFGWQTQDLHPSGACGDARNADAGRGRAVVEHAAARLNELLQEVSRFPLEALRDRT